ncbi:MAG: DUF1697 domain-containing protein [Bacteroidales bacterium]|nr:DUF1697 domain-containing protein [Bacteroidales bacterium]
MTYICLLRGINVSGQKLIKMEYLREVFGSMEFSQVRTYIQSGNIVFESNEQSEKTLLDKIEKHLHTILGYPVVTFLRTQEYWELIIRNTPFAEKINNNDYKLYVTLFPSQPAEDMKTKILKLNTAEGNFFFNSRELYSMIKKNTSHDKLFPIILLKSSLK